MKFVKEVQAVVENGRRLTEEIRNQSNEVRSSQARKKKKVGTQCKTFANQAVS